MVWSRVRYSRTFTPASRIFIVPFFLQLCGDCMRRMELEPFNPPLEEDPPCPEDPWAATRKRHHRYPWTANRRGTGILQGPGGCSGIFLPSVCRECVHLIKIRPDSHPHPSWAARSPLSWICPWVSDPINYRERSRGLRLQQECSYRGCQSPSHMRRTWIPAIVAERSRAAGKNRLAGPM